MMRVEHDHQVLLARAETFVVAVVRSSIWGCLGSASLLYCGGISWT